jgi:hypothetical protein
MKKSFALLAVAAMTLTACKPAFNGATDIQRINAIPKVIFGKALVPNLTTPAHYRLQDAATDWIPAPIGTIISCRNAKGTVVGTTTVKNSNGTYSLSVTVGQLVSSNQQKSVAFVDVLRKNSAGKTFTLASAPFAVKRSAAVPTPAPSLSPGATDEETITIDATSTVVSSKVAAAAIEGRDTTNLANENRPAGRVALTSDAAFQATVTAITLIGNFNPEKLGAVISAINSISAASANASLTGVKEAIKAAAREVVAEVNSGTLTAEQKLALITNLNTKVNVIDEFVEKAKTEVANTPKPSDSVGN